MMDFEGTTYRPPIELDTPLLQVTIGCSHNSCLFCNMYRDVRFRTIDLDQITSNIKEIKYIFPKVPRIFLVNGDAFVLSANQLKNIAQCIIEYLPECLSIAMYASIRNIKSKSDDELKMLKDLRINDLYVGIETGHKEALEYIEKGHSLIEAHEQLERLNRLGIAHIDHVMLGVAGSGIGISNAHQTADFLNQSHPKMVWIGTTGIFEGAPLSQEVQSGRFTPATELEMLEEEKELIRLIRLNHIPVYGTHPSNTIKVFGKLPEDREKMINIIDDGIKTIGRQKLTKAFRRCTL
jgi:radical SAM superfamily enzyme